MEENRIEIKDVIDDPTDIGTMEFVKVSDKLWRIGCLDDIKSKVSPELFCLHIGINLVGIWQSEGWASIIGEQADFIPYIQVALTELDLPDIAEAFETVIRIYPEWTVFRSNDAEYYDIYNFLNTLSYKPQDEKLKKITQEKRRDTVKLMRDSIGNLDVLTEKYWGSHSECDGWKPIIDYLKKKL